MNDIQRAAVRVVSWYPFVDVDPDDRERFTKWIADDRFEGAQFQSRHDPRMFAIVHRSTKTPGRWQVSWFDDDGAIGDGDRASANEALKEVPPRGWRLRLVKIGNRTRGKAS